jgi:hypothetical protein
VHGAGVEAREVDGVRRHAGRWASRIDDQGQACGIRFAIEDEA